MAFVSTFVASTAELRPTAKSVATAQNDFFILDRLVLLAGGLAVGTIFGFLTLIALGRQPMIDLVVVGSMLVMIALNLASQTLRESLAAERRLCTIAMSVNCAALLCWPLVMVPFLQNVLWVAPAFAASSLLVLTCSWRGSSRAIYRVAWQGSIVAALAAYVGGLTLMS
jgi:hypothetical protein